MQIIIVQTEIEEAIRNHILSQITVRDDMQIDIDLSATRGPNGFTATIDIRKADLMASTADTEVQASRSPSTMTTDKPLGIADTVTKARTTRGSGKALTTSSSSEESAPVTGSTETTAEQEPSSIAEEIAPATSASTDMDAAAPAPSSGKSLFGNLKKPVNTPAPESQEA